MKCQSKGKIIMKNTKRIERQQKSQEKNGIAFAQYSLINDIYSLADVLSDPMKVAKYFRTVGWIFMNSKATSEQRDAGIPTFDYSSFTVTSVIPKDNKIVAEFTFNENKHRYNGSILKEMFDNTPNVKITKFERLTRWSERPSRVEITFELAVDFRRELKGELLKAFDKRVAEEKDAITHTMSEIEQEIADLQSQLVEYREDLDNAEEMVYQQLMDTLL